MCTLIQHLGFMGTFFFLFFFFFSFLYPSLLFSWMFEHDCLDTSCLRRPTCMCFVFLYLHLFGATEHVSHLEIRSLLLSTDNSDINSAINNIKNNSDSLIFQFH